MGERGGGAAAGEKKGGCLGAVHAHVSDLPEGRLFQLEGQSQEVVGGQQLACVHNCARSIDSTARERASNRRRLTVLIGDFISLRRNNVM